MRGHVIFLAALLAGCTTTDAPLETQSLRGTLELTEGLEVRSVRVSIAPWDAPGQGEDPRAPVALSRPLSLARTPLAQDHWVLVIELTERAPGSAQGAITARLEWNGEAAGALHLAAAAESAAPAARGVELRYDVGPRLEPSSLYILTTTKE